MEPQIKRQKRGDEEVASEIIAFGGPMYDEATARKLLQEAVRVPAGWAADGEAVIGFNPDDASLDSLYCRRDDGKSRVGGGSGVGYATPITYFADKGDAKMCRYLVSRGASTTKTSEQDIPLYAMYAAANHGHLDICKLLYANGAQDDVRRDDGDGWTPFRATTYNDRDEIKRKLAATWTPFMRATCRMVKRGHANPLRGGHVSWWNAATRSRHDPKPHPSVLERQFWSSEAHL